MRLCKPEFDVVQFAGLRHQRPVPGRRRCDVLLNAARLHRLAKVLASPIEAFVFCAALRQPAILADLTAFRSPDRNFCALGSYFFSGTALSARSELTTPNCRRTHRECLADDTFTSGNPWRMAYSCVHAPATQLSLKKQNINVDSKDRSYEYKKMFSNPDHHYVHLRVKFPWRGRFHSSRADN